MLNKTIIGALSMRLAGQPPAVGSHWEECLGRLVAGDQLFPMEWFHGPTKHLHDLGRLTLDPLPIYPLRYHLGDQDHYRAVVVLAQKLVYALKNAKS